MKLTTLITLFLTFLAFGPQQPAHAARRKANIGNVISRIKPPRGLTINPQFRHARVCKELLNKTVGVCCDVPDNTISTTRPPVLPHVREEVLQCPAPREDIIRRVKCIETPYSTHTFAQFTTPPSTKVSKQCNLARKKYEANCGTFNPKACPSEVTVIPDSLKMYPLCSQIREFWYGEDGKEAIACNPLGSPDPEEFPEEDFIPNYSDEEETPEIPVATTNPDGSDDTPTSQTPSEEDLLSPIPEDYNNSVEALRLEIPGSFVRYQGVTNFIRPMINRISSRSGIECDEYELSCGINPLLIKKDENDDNPFLLDYLNTIEDTRRNILKLTAVPYSSDGGNQDGISIKRFIYGIGAVDGQDYDEAIADVLIDANTSGSVGEGFATAISGLFSETFQMRVGWSGSLNISPAKKNTGADDVVRFDIKEGASMKWLPTHLPESENGYQSGYQKDHYIDSARAIFGLDTSSCNYLKNFRYIEENSDTLMNANGKYLTYQNTYFCNCGPAVGEENFDGDLDKVNYCVFDPYQKSRDVEVEFKFVQQITLHLNGGTNQQQTSVVPIVKTVKFPLFKTSNMNQTYKALEMHQKFMAYAQYENYTYNSYDSTLTGEPITEYYTNALEYLRARNSYVQLSGTDRSLLGVLNTFNEGQLQPVRGSIYSENNIRNYVIINQNLAEAACIENDTNVLTDQRQFTFNSSSHNFITYDELESRQSLSNFFDFTDPYQKQSALWAINKYGCAQTKLGRVNLDTTSAGGQNYVTSASGIEAKVNTDLGKYLVEIESNLGMPGIIWFDFGLSASLEQKMEKRWWTNIFRWVIKIIFKLVSAVLSMVTTLLSWAIYGLIGSDFIGFDLGDITLTSHHAISHNTPASDLGETLSHQLRRISATMPEITLNSFSTFEFDAPSCDVSENFSVVDGPSSFLHFLARTIVGCPIELFSELIEFLLTPIQGFFLDIVNYFFDATNLIIKTINDALIPEMDLYGHNDLVDFLHDAQRFQFNPNFTGNYDNPLADDPTIDPSAGNFLSMMCSVGQTPELTCLATQLLTNPKLGNANVKGCVKRIGAKTHDQSLDDLRETSFFEESFDFPTARFCDKRDAPMQIDIDLAQSNGDRSVLDQLDDMDEIDQIYFNKQNIGYQHQCSSFYDVKFIGVAKFLSSPDPLGDRQFIEFLPSKRTNYLINNVFLCEDSYSCNPQGDVIKAKAKIAGCSLVADMWFHQISAGDEQDVNPTNLLDFLTDTSQTVRNYRTVFLTSYNNFYCNTQEDPQQCKDEMEEFIDNITEKADYCKSALAQMGAENFTYTGEGNVEDKVNDTCKMAE